MISKIIFMFLSTGAYGQWTQRSCSCSTRLCAPGWLLQPGHRDAEETGHRHRTSSGHLGLCCREAVLCVLNQEIIRKTASLKSSEKMFYSSRFATCFVFDWKQLHRGFLSLFITYCILTFLMLSSYFTDKPRTTE